MTIKNTVSGFHLIEILIVLALTAIMSHWMLAKYQYIIANERRREAEQTLFALAAALEEYAVTYHSYRGATLRKLKMMSLAAGKNYELNINFVNENDFLISAHPLSRQAELDKRCGVLLLSATGEKNITGDGKINECW